MGDGVVGQGLYKFRINHNQEPPHVRYQINENVIFFLNIHLTVGLLESETKAIE